MDEFFQRLREIQKKERSISGLSSVGDSFYTDVSNYLNALMRKIDDNPFSFESYLLRDAQRIVEEICERREHKIANSAVMNVQRAHQLFKESKGKKSRIKKENPITVPVNSTPEEENLYFKIVDSLVKYREKMTEPLRSYLNKNHGNPIGVQEKGNTDVTQHPESSEFSDAGIVVKTEETVPKTKPEPVTVGLVSESSSRSKKGKKSVKGSMNGGESGFEDQIYEIYGSEPSKSSSGASNQDQSSGSSETPVTNITEEHSKLNSETTNAAEKGSTKTLLILDELPSILGVDKNVYGPVIPQDIVNMPEANAKILIKNKKGMAIQRYK